MNTLEFFLYLVVGAFGLFLVKRFLESWFGSEDEEEYYEDDSKKYLELQDKMLSSISTISDNKKLVEKVTEIHHHHKTENHYHVYNDSGHVRSERAINPKKLLGENS
jgi:hypothetical protein